jgi:HAD superfamily hydrolase (TIGR01457 family)
MNFVNGGDALKRLRSVRCFVLDMDGTFYLGDKLLEGSLKFYDTVRDSGRRVLFLTNNSSRDGEYYLEKLRNMGCGVRQGDVYTSGMATCRYLNRVMKGRKVFLLGNKYLRSEFRENGVPLSKENPEIVVIGFDTTLDYEKLCQVCDLVRSGMPYIATHPDYNCPTETGFVPDTGSIIAFIQASTGRYPDYIVGKPNEGIVLGMLDQTGLAASELCICGDRLYTDIATGANNGILSVCVLTGEAKPADIEASQVKPDLVFERLSDILENL